MASIARPPHGLQETVKALLEHKPKPSRENEEEHPQDPPIVQPSQYEAPSQGRQSQHSQPRVSAPSSPKLSSQPASPRLGGSSHIQRRSIGTGPPRSISYNYSLSGSHPASRTNSNDGYEDWHHDHPNLQPTDEDGEYEETIHSREFPPPTTPFRSALEYTSPEQREREREAAEKKGKRRERERDGYFHEVFKTRWITDSPKEGHPQLQLSEEAGDGEIQEQQRVPAGHRSELNGRGKHSRRPTLQSPPSSTAASLSRFVRRTKSLPHLNEENGSKDEEKGKDAKQGAVPRWNRLKSFLPSLAAQGRAEQHKDQTEPSSALPQSINITDELLVGGLAPLVLRMWFERDERGHRRVPILFHRLRIRVSDSLHPLHGRKAVFRIECDYANGAARWVVYRQYGDFVSLHARYFASTVIRSIDALPDFPHQHGYHYFNWLKERRGSFTRAEFARIQRQDLENYLIGLIRAVMFHPSSNRLAAFLEMSALSTALAQSGGSQYKAGFLRIEAVSNKGPFGKRGTSWIEKKKQKWCAVRESYLVVSEEMGELTVHDVFLIDSDFKIDRPRRYYRQGLNLLTHPEIAFEDERADREEKQETRSQSGHSIRSRISKILHVGHKHDSIDPAAPGNVTRPVRQSSESTASSSSSGGEGAELARQITPILDPSTNTNPLLGPDPHRVPGQDTKKTRRHDAEVSKHTFYIENSQMRLKLFAKDEREMLQWIAALERVAKESHYNGKNRFDSFAPIRLNVAAQWLVDGRDYFWNMSRAIMLARECIYIHDWWLSPELQLRRPNMEKYRLDSLLERKAKEGVKIYVILYQEVSSRTTPTDSNYAKQRLSNLHPNIMVQRSPSHFQTGTFYWAHHEKMCVIDQAIAFMGGLDACFGRWDTPQHVLVDDPESGDPADTIWPGKDYSNPRVNDFHALNKPFEDMYDRGKVPRMPWHDVSMQIVGQPARDLSRHFVQRWNYLLRIKNHTRTMPSLLPPPEFKPGELSALGLTGTCELQICRSAGPWSLGTPDRTECSIQNAYLKAIQMSEHFVYIENQFFISSTVVNEVKIENKIGDAIVHRIIRAHRENTPFKVCIVIPLLPGFTFPVDHSDASAIRIIIECQNRTLCRGPNSIFARLRKEGIEPDDYINVFSLRNWAKLRGDVLTTEQVYIHAKVLIVDDRLAIIGSANINERSQRGDRDSEVAAVIRDTDMIDCTMAGQPFKVGRFAHTLRVRLMREHLGVDVDAMYEEDLMSAEPVKETHEQEEWDPDVEQEHGTDTGITHVGKGERRNRMSNMWHDALDGIEQAVHGSGDVEAKDTAMLMRKVGLKSKGLDATAADKSLEEERQTFTRDGKKQHGFTSSVVPTMEEKLIAEYQLSGEREEHVEQGPTQNGHAQHLQNGEALHGKENGDTSQRGAEEARTDGELFGAPANADTQHDDRVPGTHADNTDSEFEEKAVDARSVVRKHLTSNVAAKQYILPTPSPHIDPHGFEDPISDDFWKKMWLASAVHNTEIYRKVFHAIPDDLVTTWKQYKEFVGHHERLNQPAKEQQRPDPVGRVPSEAGDNTVQPQPSAEATVEHSAEESVYKTKDYVEQGESNPPSTPGVTDGPEGQGRTRKTSKSIEPFTQEEREAMEKLLEELRGHLVLYPNRFLEGEDIANNFLFNADRLLPLPIYD